MRLFLILGARYDEIETLVSVLRDKGHRILYWVGSLNDDEKKIPGAVFHAHRVAWSGVPARGVDAQNFPPPSQKLIERFFKLESEILTMMNKRYEGVCVDARRHIYYNMLQYWHGVLKKYQPDTIVFSIVPHTVYNYIIYELARYLGIKIIMYDATRVCDRCFFSADWRQGSEALQKELEANRGRDFSIKDLCPDLQEYYNLHSNPDYDSTPPDLKHQRQEFSTKNKWKSRIKKASYGLRDGSILTKAAGFMARQFTLSFKPNLRKEYVSHQIKPDLSNPFVYVPLAYQPERGTSPHGDIFVDQILMLETLAASLPKGWAVYVKEHPVQWWRRQGVGYSSDRYPGYYTRISSIKNVYLVPVQTNTYALINRARAVAVAGAGTAGWEAIMRGKPVIVFGYPWYKDAPGLFRADSVESCQDAFRKVVGGARPEPREVINYLKCLDKVSFRGSLSFSPGQYSPSVEQELKDNVVKAIISKVEEYAQLSKR